MKHLSIAIDNTEHWIGYVAKGRYVRPGEREFIPIKRAPFGEDLKPRKRLDLEKAGLWVPDRGPYYRKDPDLNPKIVTLVERRLLVLDPKPEDWLNEKTGLYYRPYSRSSTYALPGTSYFYGTCPFCDTEAKIYIWSLAGGGKKCSGCESDFCSFGLSSASDLIMIK